MNYDCELVGKIGSMALINRELGELFYFCDGASRKGAHGMFAKLQYIQEPIKNGTTVIIGSPKYSIPDLINGTVNRTIFRVR